MTSALKLSNDRKVSPRSRWSNGNQRWEPEVPNSFGLPAGPLFSCPGATSLCQKVCYAKRTEQHFSSAARLVRHNWDTLQALGDNVPAMAQLLGDMIGEYRRQLERVERLRSVEVPKVFRIHWDGDFYSHAYAQAWATVIHTNLDVQFWAYTRSYGAPVDVLGDLQGLPNLTLYLSVDRHNVAAADDAIARHPWILIATMGDTFSDAAQLSEALTGRNMPACPELTGRIPLVDDAGTGACATCGLCIYGRQGVRFSISKR